MNFRRPEEFLFYNAGVTDGGDGYGDGGGDEDDHSNEFQKEFSPVKYMIYFIKKLIHQNLIHICIYKVYKLLKK